MTPVLALMLGRRAAGSHVDLARNCDPHNLRSGCCNKEQRGQLQALRWLAGRGRAAVGLYVPSMNEARQDRREKPLRTAIASAF
jgi:hypothetical protein